LGCGAREGSSSSRLPFWGGALEESGGLEGGGV